MGGTVDGGVTDGEDCNHNYDVEDAGKARDAGVGDNKDERRGLTVEEVGGSFQGTRRPMSISETR